MSDASSIADLIARLHEQRKLWVVLSEEPARKLQISRPTEADMGVLRGKTGMDLYRAYADLVSDWKGFTLADLGGEAADRVPFSRAAWDALWVDRMDWLTAVGEAANKAFIDHRLQQGEAEKN